MVRLRGIASPLLTLAIAVVLVPAPQASSADYALVPDSSAMRLGEPTLELVKGVIRAMRLRDYDIAVLDDEGVPKGWHALSGGLHLRVTENGRSSDVWALPDDWVAVRTAEATDPQDPPAEIITMAGVRWATMRDTVSDRFFERFRDPSPRHDPADHRVPAQRPLPKRWTPEQVARQSALARETFERFCLRADERAAGLRSLASLGVPAFPLYRDSAQDPDTRVSDAAISALATVVEGAGISFLGTLLTHEDAAPDHRHTAYAAALALRRIADPASIPDLLTALGSNGDPETILVVVDALAGLQCREASPRLLELLRSDADTARRAAYAKALSTLRVGEAIPLIRGLIASTDIMGDDLCHVPRTAGNPSLLLSYLKLTAPWSPIVDHARILLLPCTPAVPLGKGCSVTLLIESCGEAIDSVTYLDGVLTVDGVEHQHSMGAVIGNFTVLPGNAGCHVLDLSAAIAAAGTHRVGYRCGALIAHDLDLVVASP
jgi:hypothetical protein